jgi:hypothetical protein
MLLALGLLVPSLMEAQSSFVNWSAVDGGFASHVIAGNTRALSVAGQAFVGVSTGGGNIVTGGFLGYPFDPRLATGLPESGVEVLPLTYGLSQNYPNPFNPSTSIQYTVAGARDQGSGISEVKLTVYDLLGREVAVLVNERKPAGSYEISFDANNLASGVYIYRLTARPTDGGQAGSFVQTRKMILLK